MLTVSIELATNTIPEELSQFIHNNPSVMGYGIIPDRSDEAKEKVKKYIKSMNDEIYYLESDWLYHEAEASGSRKEMEIAKQRYKQLKDMMTK